METSMKFWIDFSTLNNGGIYTAGRVPYYILPPMNKEKTNKSGK